MGFTRQPLPRAAAREWLRRSMAPRDAAAPEFLAMALAILALVLFTTP
jgi:hypothetical protein